MENQLFAGKTLFDVRPSAKARTPEPCAEQVVRESRRKTALHDVQFDEVELAWIGDGMAKGHLTQARYPVRPQGRRTSLAVIQLEHTYQACEWLMFAARHKVLASV